MAENYKIISRNGHYEVYDEKDDFLFSGDTYAECKYEIDELFAMSRI